MEREELSFWLRFRDELERAGIGWGGRHPLLGGLAAAAAEDEEGGPDGNSAPTDPPLS